MAKQKRNNNKKYAEKGRTFRSKKSGGGRIKEIVFDPEARREHLKGFSERKRARRAFGLAMQKVKDRKEKLEERKDRRKAMIEQVEEAEKQKEEIRQALLLQQADDSEKSDDDENSTNDNDNDSDTHDMQHDETNINEAAGLDSNPSTTTAEYRDQFGAQVTVTTSEIPDSDDEDAKQHGKKRSVDKEQQYAGDVDKFLSDLKGNMPSKRKVTQSNPHFSPRKGGNKRKTASEQGPNSKHDRKHKKRRSSSRRN